MMQIDRSNYEIWVIDWLDGKLDEEQTGKLYQFFAENPDLKEESEDLGITMLHPSEETFHNKNTLKKTPANLTESQFEFLCAAYLENDLTGDQIQELKEASVANPERSKSFELFMKTKLMPLNVTYKGKGRLIRKTPSQKIIQLSFIGLSAAAIIVFAVLTFVSRQQPLPVRSEKVAAVTSQNQIPGTIPSVSGTEKEILKAAKSNNNKPAKKVIQTEKPDMNKEKNMDSFPGRQPVAIEKIKISPRIALKSELPAEKLIASNISTVIFVLDEEPYDNGRSKVGKFVAKTFREKILNQKAPEDKPLKAFEIAEAGVSGLNRILGWQMALNQKTDESGKPKSVYFSSKILKINAPVKKSEPLQ